jgi:4-alpha-glucanotransferase
LYLRIEQTAAYREADPDTKSTVDGLRPANDTDLIDYDAVWDAKQRALELLWQSQKPTPDRDDFATYCALAEAYGPDWRTWPDELRRPDSAAVATQRLARADRVGFHAWLQLLCEEQLAAAAKAAKGMRIGIVHDLAVGVDPGGADAWMLQDVLAQGVHVGAPPDAFNQRGQDWGLAAWRPDRLAATGYRAYRDLLAATFKHSAGLRVDHVAGLWRLWWIPPGASPDQGTYVRYDADAMLGALTVEAHLAGATVIGEDLGTVPPKVTRTLRQRHILGSTVLWFARDWRKPEAPFIRPRRWPELSLATVSTHDLPTVQGFLTGDHVRLRAEAGVLTRSVVAEQAAAEKDLEALKTLLRKEGIPDTDMLLALHELLARSPARILMASPYDVLGEVRQPNLPGTFAEYPNWRIPLPVLLEDFIRDPRTAAVIKVLRRDPGAVHSRTNGSRSG